MLDVAVTQARGLMRRSVCSGKASSDQRQAKILGPVVEFQETDIVREDTGVGAGLGRGIDGSQGSQQQAG